MKKLSDYHELKYKLMEEENISLFPKRYEVMLNELRHLEKGRLLDIGCGEGVLLENAKILGFDVTGVDCSEYAVEMCHKKNLDATCLDIEGQGLPFNEEFDIVIAAEVIEHLYDSYGFLASVNKCLREKGLLFLTTPNSAQLVYRVLCMLGKTPTGISSPLHIRFFSLSHLLSICRDQGFKLEKNLACASFPRIKNSFKVPSFLSSLLARNFILVLQKDGTPKYSDLTPVLKERHRAWLSREGRVPSEKPSQNALGY